MPRVSEIEQAHHFVDSVLPLWSYYTGFVPPLQCDCRRATSARYQLLPWVRNRQMVDLVKVRW